jgi:putative transposase
MTTYRRNFVAGGSYFFTVNLAESRLRLLTEHIELLRVAFRYARRRHPFVIDAMVVLPDHLHTIWTLPRGDGDFPVRWRLIKASFSRAKDGGHLGQSLAQTRARDPAAPLLGTHAARRRRFRAAPRYIHFNPVKHGYVKRVGAWPFSSLHRMVRLGLYPATWAGGATDQQSGFGER